MVRASLSALSRFIHAPEGRKDKNPYIGTSVSVSDHFHEQIRPVLKHRRDLRVVLANGHAQDAQGAVEEGSGFFFPPSLRDARGENERM